MSVYCTWNTARRCTWSLSLHLFQGVLLSMYTTKNKEIIIVFPYVFWALCPTVSLLLLSGRTISFGIVLCISFCSGGCKLLKAAICCFHKRPRRGISAISVKVLALRLFQQENLDLGTLVHLLNFILSALASMTWVMWIQLSICMHAGSDPKLGWYHNVQWVWEKQCNKWENILLLWSNMKMLCDKVGSVRFN